MLDSFRRLPISNITGDM